MLQSTACLHRLDISKHKPRMKNTHRIRVFGGALKKGSSIKQAFLYVHSLQAVSWHVCSHSDWDL